MLQNSLQPIVKWLDQDELSAIYSSEYWNNLEEEKSKEWWIADGSDASYQRLRAFLTREGLINECELAEQFIATLPGADLAIADLASGIGWTSVRLSKLPNVGSVHSVEISQHRLELLYPQAVAMFDGVAPKLKRYLGSFYDLGFADGSMDVVFLSAAFHHASNALRLLSEVDRVLKPGGTLILIGENIISRTAIARRMLKKLLTERRFCSNFYELFPPDQEAGDHYYRASDYYFFLQLMGCKLVKFRVQRNASALVIAEKSDTPFIAKVPKAVFFSSSQGGNGA